MNKQKMIVAIISVLVVALLISIPFVLDEREVELNNETGQDYHTLILDDVNYKYNTSVIPILFLGIDKKDDTTGLGQADVLELILLNRKEETIQVISLSRDIMTDIRMFDVARNDLGWQQQHLNLAYAYGSTESNGCLLSAQAVSRLFNNVPIAKFAAMPIDMIDDVHSIVGTLEVTIPNDSLKELNEAWVKDATIILTEENVQQYLQTRDTEIDFSNNDRMERQEVYLKAYMAKIKELLDTDFDGTINKIYDLCQNMTTNISFTEIETYGKMLLSYQFDPETDYYTLEGENVLGIHDQFEVDKKALNSLLVDLFYMEGE